MEAIRETQKKYCSRAIAAAIAIGLVLIISGYKPMGKGLILGTLFSVVNFVVMGEILPMKIGKSGKKTFILSLGSILLRYLLMAVPLVLAIKLERFHLLSTVVGIFMIQFVIVFEHLLISAGVIRKKQA
jgi:hypothetical protein